MGILYQWGLGLALLIAAPVLLSTRRRHYLPTLRGRLGREVPPGPQEALWIHAVSVGEAMVAASVVRALPSDLPVVVTTITPTGQERARALLGSRAAVTYLPFDLAWTLDPFLDSMRPRALILVEGDYWPLMLSRVAERGLPTATINARVGDRSFERQRRLPFVTRKLMGRIDRIGAQSELDARRLVALGVPEERVHVTGNLKYEAPDPVLAPHLEETVRRMAAGRAILVCGSTMSGEERQILEAFREQAKRALLVLAPRHPERWDDVATVVEDEGFRCARRSSEAGGDSEVDVLLLDSLGELAGLYRIADAAFIGGTLSGTGGHNPLEPARFGIPTAVGPSMENFRDMEKEFDRARAWARVRDAGDLAHLWSQWIDAPDAAQEIGERAAALVASNQGALQRTLELIRPLIEAVEA